MTADDDEQTAFRVRMRDRLKDTAPGIYLLYAFGDGGPAFPGLPQWQEDIIREETARRMVEMLGGAATS